jgi:hypothetical protein
LKFEFKYVKAIAQPVVRHFLTPLTFHGGAFNQARASIHDQPQAHR